MTESKISLEEAQIFVMWFWETYKIILSIPEARTLMSGTNFRRLNKFTWKLKENA